jgi:threonine synthase
MHPIVLSNPDHTFSGLDMKYVLGWCALLGLMTGLAAAPAMAQQAQPQSGARQLPARTIPVPDTVSPQMQAIIARPLNPIWNVVPKTAAEWKAVVAKNAEETIATLPAMRAALHVNIEPTTIAGVKVLYCHAQRDPARQPQPPALVFPWRRICSAAGRGRLG